MYQYRYSSYSLVAMHLSTIVRVVGPDEEGISILIDSVCWCIIVKDSRYISVPVCGRRPLPLCMNFLLTKTPATQLLAPRAACLWGLGAPQGAEQLRSCMGSWS